MYKYDSTQVRTNFRRKFCHDLVMPSGKYSGHELYPITEDEINTIVNEDSLITAPKDIGKKIWATISEWMLWYALRVKYGINYMTPLSKTYLWALDDPDQDEIELFAHKNTEIEDMVERVETLMDLKFQAHEDDFHAVPKHWEEIEEKSKKNYKEYLTI